MTKIKQKKLSERTRELAMKAASGKARFGKWFSEIPGLHSICPLGQLLDGNYLKIVGTVGPYWRDEFSISIQKPKNDVYIFPLLALADEFEEAGL